MTEAVVLVDYTPVKDDALLESLGSAPVLAWFAEHLVDGRLVPLGSPIVLDTNANEWRFELFRVNESGRPFVDPVTGEAAKVTVWRAFHSLPPWADRQAREFAELLAEG